MTDDARTPHNGDNTVGPRDSYQILTGSKLDSILRPEPCRILTRRESTTVRAAAHAQPRRDHPLEAAMVPLALHG